jgi:hypothetical protein
MAASKQPPAAPSDDFDVSQETRLVKMSPLAMPAAPGPLGTIRVDPLPPSAKPKLEVMVGANRGEVFAMTKSLIILGRIAEVADLVIQDDSASRHHAAIAYQGGRFTLFDLGSSNGTFVAGKRVTCIGLEHGSEIAIGRSVLVFWLQ